MNALYAPQVRHACLSLPARSDRRFVFTQLAPPLLRQRVSFFAGLESDLVSEGRVRACTLRFALKNMTKSSWAVRYSKRRVLREFLRSSDEVLLFYEDDCWLSCDFEGDASLLLATMPPGWHIGFLGGQARPVADRPASALPSPPSADNHCVMLSREGAQRVLARLGKPDHGYSDQVIARMIHRGELTAYWTGRYTAHQRISMSDNGHAHSADPLCISKHRPWMAVDDASVVAAAVNSGDVVVEWGSGGSTSLIASRMGPRGRLLSIEHDEPSLARTHDAMRRFPAPTGDVQVLHMPPHPNRTDRQWRGLPTQFASYVAAPGGIFQTGSVDVVLVDGRLRIECCRVARHLLKSGGLLLIHDFWSRERYRRCLDELLEWATIVCSTPSCSTPRGAGDMIVLRKGRLASDYDKLHHRRLL